MGTADFFKVVLLGQGRGGIFRGGLRPRRAHPYPPLKVGHNLRFEPAVRGHLRPVVANGMHQQAFGRLSGNQGRPGVTATPQSGGRIQMQAPFELLGGAGMAFVAPRRQDRLDDPALR